MIKKRTWVISPDIERWKNELLKRDLTEVCQQEKGLMASNMNGEAAKGGDSDTSFLLGLANVNRSTNGISSVEVEGQIFDFQDHREFSFPDYNFPTEGKIAAYG